MEVTHLNDLVFDRQNNLQNQLYQQVVNKIVKGELTAGMKLPASRQLAKELGISRNTIMKTIEQLVDEGYLQTRLGSGVYINSDMNKGLLTIDSLANNHVCLPELSHYAQSFDVSANDDSPDLPFSPGLTAMDEFPMEIWQRLTRRHSDRKALCGYNGGQGYLPLRAALAEYLAHSRGVKCSAEQIIITQGAQQAISLCAQVLLNSGEKVIMEEPGYRSAKNSFSAYQAKILTAPLLDEALDINSLKQDCYQQAKLLYCTPTHQYPMGGILSASDRLALLDWAMTSNTWIIEDDYDSEFHFTQKPVAAIQGLATTTPVIYMGSFSKTLFAALRLGYLVVPKAIVNHFVTIKSAMSGETPMLSQAIVADFITEGHFARHLRRMRISYQRKWQHFNQLLQQLPTQCQIVAHSVGMHLVLKITNIDDLALKQYLITQGFSPSALSDYYQGEEKETGLTLGFANTSIEQREQLVKLIAQYLQQK